MGAKHLYLWRTISWGLYTLPTIGTNAEHVVPSNSPSTASSTSMASGNGEVSRADKDSEVNKQQAS
jgi:hypothetical protein